MDSVKLATCSSQVGIWNLPDLTPVHKFSKDSGKVTSVSWNHDGSVLASCNTFNPDRINLTVLNNNVYRTIEIPGPEKSQIRALHYPNSSQKSLCLAVNDHVMLYDVQKKKIREDFQKIPNVTCLTTDRHDKYIAAGNTNGCLYLLNLRTGRQAFTHPIRIAEDDTSLTSTRFSNIKLSMVGASTDKGTLAFWDVIAAKEIQKFNEHKAPSTGLAFSPVNEVLVLSSGLDKRCVCYDTLTKKPASTISTELPLTSVEFASDGTNLVLGTTQGLVYLYDLRYFNNPSAVIDTETKSPVTSVLFQPGGDRANVSAILSSLSKASSISSASTTQNKSQFVTLKENLKPEEFNSSLGSQVFSPLRDVSAVGSPNISSMTPVPLQISNCSRMSTDSVLSPLRETSFNLMVSPVSNLSIPAKKFSTPPLLSSISEEKTNTPPKKAPYLQEYEFTKRKISSNLLSGVEEEKSNTSLSPERKLDLVKENQEAKPNHPSYLEEKSEDKKDALESIVLSDTTPFFMPKDLEVPSVPSENISTEEVRAILTAFPTALDKSTTSNTTCNRVVETNSTPKPTSKIRKSSSSEIDAFKHEYVQAAVEEAMDEFCSDMRKQLWHWHYDMIKAFQLQNQEMTALLRQNNLNESLLEEVQKLRMENAQLKSMPFVANFNQDSNEKNE